MILDGAQCVRAAKRALIAITVLAAGLQTGAQAQLGKGATMLTPAFDAHFDQLVNHQVPLNLTFTDSTGQQVQLQRYFDGKKPVILVMPFYKCTSGCTLELQGMAKAFNKLNYDVGKDFEVVTISINPKEGPANAAVQKAVYLKLYTKPGGETGWHFMTGTQPNISALAIATGYHYVANLQTEQFNHPTGIILLTPKGKIYRYFYGTDYDAQDLRIALTKASQNQIGSVVDQLISFCCSYNPTTGHYGVVIQRVIELSGTATVVILGSSILLMLRWEKRHPKLVELPGARLSTDPPEPGREEEDAADGNAS